MNDEDRSLPVVQQNVVPKLGHEAANNIEILTEAAATAIRDLGDQAVAEAEQLQRMCYSTAQDMIDQGRFIAMQTKAFAAITKEVGIRNRESKGRLGDIMRKGAAEEDVQVEAPNYSSEHDRSMADRLAAALRTNEGEDHSDNPERAEPSDAGTNRSGFENEHGPSGSLGPEPEGARSDRGSRRRDGQDG